ncbi:hypothetical protein V8E53_007676 [Lactarius tabidus]
MAMATVAKTVPPHSSNPRTHCADRYTSAVAIFRAVSHPTQRNLLEHADVPGFSFIFPSQHPPSRDDFQLSRTSSTSPSPPFITLASPFLVMYFKEVTLFVLRQRQTSDHDPRFSLPPQHPPPALPFLPRLLAPHSRTQSPRALHVQYFFELHKAGHAELGGPAPLHGVEDGVDAYEWLTHASLTPSAHVQAVPYMHLLGHRTITRSPTRLLALPVAPSAWTCSSPLTNRGLRARRDGAEGRSMPHRRLGMHLRATAVTAHEAGFFSRLRVPLHSAGASESLPPNYFQTACKVRKLVSAKGSALVVGCRDEDGVGNSLVLIPCLKPSRDADPFDGPGRAALTALRLSVLIQGAQVCWPGSSWM